MEGGRKATKREVVPQASAPVHSGYSVGVSSTSYDILATSHVAFIIFYVILKAAMGL